jgi:Glutamine amidotransferase class-I
VNTRYRNRLEGAGLRFSGLSPDGLLPEILEIPDHPWFIGVQFHPELKSRPFEPHPLFASFIGAPKGPYNLTMRLYAPKSDALTGRWNPPPVVKVQTVPAAAQ